MQTAFKNQYLSLFKKRTPIHSGLGYPKKKKKTLGKKKKKLLTKTYENLCSLGLSSPLQTADRGRFSLRGGSADALVTTNATFRPPAGWRCGRWRWSSFSCEGQNKPREKSVYFKKKNTHTHYTNVSCAHKKYIGSLDVLFCMSFFFTGACSMTFPHKLFFVCFCQRGWVVPLCLISSE